MTKEPSKYRRKRIIALLNGVRKIGQPQQKNEIWPFVPMWMELESVMLSKISHTEKDRYHMLSLICGS